MEQKRPVRFSWIAVLIAVLLLCAGAWFIATRIVDARAPQLSRAISVPATSNQDIQPLGDGLAYYDGGSLHAIDGRGRQIWAYPAGSLAKYHVGTGGVATWSGTMLSLLNAATGESLYSGNQESPIIAARLGKSYAAVQVELKANESKALTEAEREHDSVMLLLDTKGHLVQSIDLNNQTVLDFGFFRNDQLFWTMSLNTEGTEPICTITSYKPGRSISGEFSDYEQVLYDVLFTDTIRTVGLQHVKDHDYAMGKEIAANRILVYGWYMVDVDDKQASPMMAFVPTGQADGTAGITDVRTIQGQTDRLIRLPTPAKQVFVKGTTVYGFSTDQVMVCAAGAVEPLTYRLPLQIDRVIALTDNHSAIVTSGTAVFMLQLP